MLVRNVYDYSMDNPSLVVRFIRFKTTVRVNILLRTTSVLLQRCLVMCDCSTRYEHRIISAKNFCERCAFHVDDFLALKTLELSFEKILRALVTSKILLSQQLRYGGWVVNRYLDTSFLPLNRYL